MSAPQADASATYLIVHLVIRPDCDEANGPIDRVPQFCLPIFKELHEVCECPVVVADRRHEVNGDVNVTLQVACPVRAPPEKP